MTGSVGGGGARPVGWRLMAAVVVGALLALLVVGYAAASTYVYLQITPVAAGCPATEGFVDIQDPTSFTAHTFVDEVRVEVDTTRYLMPPPTTVSFAARNDPGVTIAAWWEPVDRLDAPAVIVTHGLNGCRRNSGNLLVAGMLHRHGVAVLLIDMRNHGDSTVEDGRFTFASDEYLDVLGGFDWLREQGIPATRIGLMGFSGGAWASMIAMGEEPGIAAIWADSSMTDAGSVLRKGLSDRGFPTFFDAGAVLVGRILTGEDMTARSPLAAIHKLDGRPIALTQGAKDESLDPAYLDELAAAVRASGGSPVVWQVADAGHTQAHFLHPAEYETRLVAFFAPALSAPSEGHASVDGK